MRLSEYPIANLKEVPTEAEVVSHQLMLRAGLIRRLAGGLYTWLPMGLRTLKKIEAIIREEMNRAGALECLLPTVQPAELWQESGRWTEYGPELLRLKDRHQRDYVYGPTHEEVITDLVRRELRSHRQLPVNFYQIQLKFRDEIRPRFGVMRAREFIMKDAYSFHVDEASLDVTYRRMYDAYSRIFTRCGLRFRVVAADPGAIGGTGSHEFHVLAASGEDAIAFSDGDNYAANVELAVALAPHGPRAAPAQSLATVPTPGAHTIADVAALLKVAPAACLKTLVVEGSEGALVALVLRGDHELNAFKAQKLTGVASPLRMASPERIAAELGAEVGSLGPIGLGGLMYVDYAAAAAADFVCGANRTGQHYVGGNWGRDVAEPSAVDLRNVVAGDPSPTGRGRLDIARGIEVGHIFKLGHKYSAAMKASVLDDRGQNVTPLMGCYGIGVTRVAAAAIEQNHDERGIAWPEPLAPYRIGLIPINYQKSERVRSAVEALYRALSAAGLEPLLDDRDARPGVKFADAELYGVPHRLVVSERGLDVGTLEYRHRRDAAATDVPIGGIEAFLKERSDAELAALE